MFFTINNFGQFYSADTLFTNASFVSANTTKYLEKEKKPNNFQMNDITSQLVSGYNFGDLLHKSLQN